MRQNSAATLRGRWGRWLERRDRCCHCTRKLEGGVHSFGFWFCHRHFNPKTIERWKDAYYGTSTTGAAKP